MLVGIAGAFLGVLTGCHQDHAKSLPVPSVRQVSRPVSKYTPGPQVSDKRQPVYSQGLGKVNATIVIDPGHGGHDPGTLGCSASALPEKSIVLMIANELAELLRAAGANVISTRTTDRFVELDDRAAIAERSRADLLISIHADAISKPSISGATVYISRSASRESKAAAEAICDSFEASGIECRGIRKADYRVLAKHSRPAVLVECGYLTNYGDAVRLNQSAYREKIARALARALVGSLRE